MLFSSAEFIFGFLPIALVGYYLLASLGYRQGAGAYLALASLVFYAWWKPIYLPLILLSIGVNFAIGRHLILSRKSAGRNHLCMVAGVVFNLLILGYFKYSWFVVESLAFAVGSQFRIEPMLLPLAISFFTFQQIAFLVDAAKGEILSVRFPHYTLFVAFFPQLIAGPIVHHREMMPQFDRLGPVFPGWECFQQGIRLFIMGLAKKLLIADTLAKFADLGWANASELTFFDAWGTTLCYTFQLYFDFSGYSDMALGAALLFGIRLPVNFYSPYRATSIQDFWSRWHKTLSRWLKDYLYIPLGGNRAGSWRTYRNLVLTFLLGGIWHGAGWTFVVWGLMHGLGTVVHRLWSLCRIPMPPIAAWAITFLFVHLGWVFFRAPSLGEAWQMLQHLSGVHGVVFSGDFGRVVNFLVDYQWLHGNEAWQSILPMRVLPYLILTGWIAFRVRNSVQIAVESPLRFPVLQSLFFAVLALACILASIRSAETPFLYFNF